MENFESREYRLICSIGKFYRIRTINEFSIITIDIPYSQSLIYVFKGKAVY